MTGCDGGNLILEKGRFGIGGWARVVFSFDWRLVEVTECGCLFSSDLFSRKMRYNRAGRILS